ncbi:MAG: hypothetical protein KatS3mg110_1471 [Pirellulaceae bacterium]|nr:MAG: hypothetical protein KatS3mg110_1471 [Pirellulaceae bacterium]
MWYALGMPGRWASRHAKSSQFNGPASFVGHSVALRPMCGIGPILLLVCGCVPSDFGDPNQRIFDFQNSQYDRMQLRPLVAGMARLVEPTPKGLRMHLPAGPGPERVGIKPVFSIQGDFEITASFEVVRLEQPKSGSGVGPAIHLVFQSPLEPTAVLSRLQRQEGRQVFSSYYAVWDDAQKKSDRQKRLQFRAARDKLGKLRVVRTGETLEFYVVDGLSDNFELVDRVPAVPYDVREIWLVLNRHGDSAAGEVIWKDVTIRAAGFSTPQPRPRGNWLVRAVPAVVVILAATAAVWLWWRRR